MDPQYNHQSNSAGKALPLPDEPAVMPSGDGQANPAADLIRKKVAAAYGDEPDITEAALDVAELGAASGGSKHQQFIYQLTNSGKSLPEIQAAWHEYYAGLPDGQKHQLWQEFYAAHAQASRFAASRPSMAPAAQTDQQAPQAPQGSQIPPQAGKTKTLSDTRKKVVSGATPKVKLKAKHHFQSLLFGLGVGSVVVLLFLFSFFNERFIAPFIQPSRTLSSTPIISSDQVGKSPQIIIPKINLEAPVVYGVNSIKESDIQKALESGVVHYADTAIPGQDGNVVIVGHSSNNILNRGKYKFAFALLNRLENKDTFYLHKDGKRYTYEVYDKTIVKPSDVSVLGTSDKPATVSLITCDPPGTSTNRLVVLAQQISPDPDQNSPQVAQNKLATSTTLVPGNSQSLWSRIFSFMSR